MADTEAVTQIKSEDGKDQPKKEMDTQTLLAVLQFLRKNNLNNTEALLKQEANISDSTAEQNLKAGESETTNALAALAAYKNAENPTEYEDYYSSLTSFIESSLDTHRSELALVTYPLFVHLYLELVFNQFEEKAKSFFQKFGCEQEYYYQDDLNRLSTVTKPEHMRNNQLLENFKTNKFIIRMSRDAYNYLKRHLTEKKQKKLLDIVQDHLFIDVYDGIPRTKCQIDSMAGGLVGEVCRNANKQKVYYGLLKEPDVTFTLDEEEEESTLESSTDKPKKKKIKKDPMHTKKSKNDPNAPSNTRIPLPEMKDADKAERVKCYRESVKKISLNSKQLPSVCFYTVLNSHSRVCSVEICDDSSLMAAGLSDSNIRLWTLTPQKLRSVKPNLDLNSIDREAEDVMERIMDDSTASSTRLLKGHSGPVYSTSISPDRNYLVSSSEDGTVRLWSLQTWSNLVCYKGHNYPIWDVKFSPHGHYFVSAGLDRTARLWTTDHYQPVRIFAGHLSDVECVQFHPNSNYVVTGSADRTVKLWDVSSGNCVRTMTGHKGSISSLMCSPDGKHIVSAGEDNTILVWDISSGELAGEFAGHLASVHALSFSRESTILASGGMDNTVKLWDYQKLIEDEQEIDPNSLKYSSLPSIYELESLSTKSSPVLCLHFSRRNLLLGSGPYLQ